MPGILEAEVIEMKKKLIISAIAMVLTLSNVSFAGIDIEAKSLRDEIDRYVDAGMDTAASVSIGVVMGDEIVYERQSGKIDIENGTRVDENTVYEWASVSKMLIWVSVMQLWEKGEIDLEADIREYLPDGFLTRLKYEKKITMYHLMNHTAGFQEVLHTPETAYEEDILSLEDALIKYMPAQIYEPGTVCSYSNWGAALAAFIVEKVSGEPFYEYVHEHIFTPLGMDKTAIKPDWSDNEWVREQRNRIKSYADGFSSCLFINPRSKTAVAVMTNEVGETYFNYGLLSLIFGEYRSKLPAINKAKDISGIYTSARARMDKGFGKIFRYIGMLMPLMKTDDPFVYRIAPGDIVIRQISDEFFIMDDGNGHKSLKHLVQTDDGHMGFESFTMDEFRENTVVFALNILLIIAFLLVTFDSVIRIIAFIIKSAVKKSTDKGKVKNLAVDITALIIGILTKKLLLSDTVPQAGTAAAIILVMLIMAIIQLICGIMMIKKHRGSNLFSLFMISVIIVNIVYWQWYDFLSY